MIRVGASAVGTAGPGVYDDGVSDLIARLRRREPAALGDVVSQTARRVYRAARGMGFSATDADDLVQDVFVTFLETIDRFEGRAQISTWLFGILHHKAQERRRSLSRDDLHDPVDDTFEARFDAEGHWIAPFPPPDRGAVSSEMGAAIADCMGGLPPLQQEVFHLRQVEGLSAAEVGGIVRRTATHVGVLLHRARLRLRDCLDGRGWGPSR